MSGVRKQVGEGEGHVLSSHGLQFKTRVRACGRVSGGEVGGWGRDPKKCTGSIWGMGSSTI